MKAIFLGDLHVGASKDSPWIFDIIEDGIKQVCDYAKTNNIKTLIQAGDWFDTRPAVSQVVMEFNKTKLIPMLEATFDEIIVIVGNHDMHYKEAIKPNSVQELMERFDKVSIIDKPTSIDLGATTWDLFPWMCKENRDQILEFIEKSNSDYSLGHWELDGFYFYQGMKSSGADPDFLRHYKKAYSGHYHTISENGNVKYIGTPYTLTANDANDPRGFFVFDPEDESFEFIENKNMWHFKLHYDATTWDIDPKDYTNKAVMLIVENTEKSDGKKANISKVLDGFESVCHKFGYKYNQDIVEANVTEEEVVASIKSTNDLIENRVSELEEPDEVKERVHHIMKGLHNEVRV